MKRLAAVCALFLVVAAGCGSESRSKGKAVETKSTPVEFRSKPFVPKASDIKLPALPRQGLVVSKRGGVELVGLDGRRYGFLPGLILSNPGFARMFIGDPNRPYLRNEGKNGKEGKNLYLFDATLGYSVQISLNRRELGNGFVYRRVSDRDESELQGEIARDGKRVFRLGDWSSSFLWPSSDGTTVTFSSARDNSYRFIDLRNGSIERLPGWCIVYGPRAGIPNALCTGFTKSGRSTLSLRRKDAGKWSVVFAWPHSVGEWYGGVLSPDGRHLAVVRGVPCDTHLVEIVDAQGPRRKQFGRGEPLGWSPSGKALVYLWDPLPPGCGDSVAPSSGAVYAIDPVTFKRKLIVRTKAAAMWSKTPGA